MTCDQCPLTYLSEYAFFPVDWEHLYVWLSEVTFVNLLDSTSPLYFPTHQSSASKQLTVYIPECE